jgi:lipoteichoic acid synthase
MPQSTSLSSLINTVLYRSHPFVMVNVLALPVFLLFRFYELSSVAGTDAVPIGTIYTAAVGIDILTFGSLMFFLSIVFFAVGSLFNDRIALNVHCGLLSAAGVISFALSHYYTVSHIPLGADLFGYSWNDITETVSSSGGVNVLIPVVLAAVVAVMFFLPALALRFPAPKFIVLGFYAYCIFSLPLLFLVHPDPNDFASESAFQAVENKTVSFGQSSSRYIFSNFFGSSGYSETEYPFMKPAQYDDVLSPFLTTQSAPPNIVVIIVEGLGSAFVEGGTYQGFTPFLDSLSHGSLTWKNFLSTSGRTFAVLPSLTASLPFGRQGFMELGDAMPEHRSLFTLLKANGYRTSFFYGGTIGFDKQQLFLQRQNTDQIIDDKAFPSSYRPSQANSEGFSWGFDDADLFRYSLEVLEGYQNVPRFDVYMTLSTHEPFLPPDAEKFRSQAERIISSTERTSKQRDHLVQYKDVFSSLLYTDNALREFFASYKKRNDYANTIFIITGDHRLIPVPMESKIDRYRVPFIIASPMIVRPKQFSSVSTHSDVVPTLLGFLKQKYSMTFPEDEHWIGSVIDTASEFRNLRSRAFMPFKGEISDYIHGTFFLSGDRLFTLTNRLYAEETQQDSIRNMLRVQRDEFVRLCTYVVSEQKLLPVAQKNVAAQIPVNDDSLFAIVDSWGKNSDQLYSLARDTAFKGYYRQAHIICRRLLSQNPDYHDVRSLMGSTFAWEHRYSEARIQFTEILRRSPNYADAHFGLARVEFWNGNLEGALSAVNQTISLLPNDPFARILKAKIQFTMDRDAEAMKEVELVLRTPGSPAMAEAMELKKKFTAGKFR